MCRANSLFGTTASRPEKHSVGTCAVLRAPVRRWRLGPAGDRTGPGVVFLRRWRGGGAGVGGTNRNSFFSVLGRRRARMPKREGYTQPSRREPGLRGSQSSTLRPAVGLFRKAVGHTRSGLHAERGVCCNGMCHGLARAERPARHKDVAAPRMARVLCPAHVRLEILIPRKARLGRPASVPLHAPAHRSALKFSVPVASASPI